AGLVGGIHANISRPFDFLEKNLQMGLNLVSVAKKLGIKKVLNLGSSCMYPKNFEEAIPEKALLTGELEETNEGYAIAKIAVAKACEYISRENSNYFYKTIIPCNLYGKYDKFDDNSSHMIPAVIKKIHHAKINNVPEIEIWGDGNSRREFMYAEDLADLIFYVIPKIEFMPNMVNAGLGYDYSINDYYKIIAEEIGYTGSFSHDLTKPTGMKRKLVDISLLNKIGWSSHFELRDGIRKTYNYYLENQNK
ncbi:NAD-dependent epimerase/dehydratase family protein, partial [Escherichia coli]|nr:NAD-dependent epimerase/dehydratase family protein [Escherichia coli]EES2428064.1 NAD-dependent epimerase/dehydratase family protein [Escherichia coli]EGZ8842677.1 NAD-dependent epimerase/dehydratase family protein [Escherichia coli]EHF0988237.1 NAD-dependent epimerase/dehydratase family protein [Escherichia coli]